MCPRLSACGPQDTFIDGNTLRRYSPAIAAAALSTSWRLEVHSSGYDSR